MEISIKDQIAPLYLKLQNVWKVGIELNIPGQTVHKYLVDKNLINKMNYFTKDDELKLIETYKSYRDVGNLKELANIMCRTVPFLARKAKSLGLTDRDNRISMKPFAIQISINTKKFIQDKGHPKGMLGKKHTEELKKEMSLRSKALWDDPNSIFNSNKFKQKQSDHMALMQASGRLNNNYSRTKNGSVKIDERVYFYRSSWEVNIASFLQFQKENNLIKEWEYEPDVFWFEKIKRGVRSYKPDFKITKVDGAQYYIEVKGWMDDKSKTKLRRMKLYFPNVIIDLIDVKRYNIIKNNASLYKYWGALDNDEFKIKQIPCKIEGCENKNHSKDVCRKHFYKLYKK